MSKMKPTIKLNNGGNMKKAFLLWTASAFLSLSLIIIGGCASSEETIPEPATPPGPTELDLTKQKLDDCTKENVQLKQQASRLEQDVRNLTARAAALETQLAEEKTKLPPPPPPKPVIKDVDAEYQNALTLFRQKSYREAADKLQALLDAGIKKDLEDNCYYWLGECSFGMKDYKTAISNFEKVFAYKISEKKDDAAIMIANSYWEMGNKKEAIKEYKKFLEKYPASPYVKRAKERLGEKAKEEIPPK
jgi:TolA-binding protein